MNYFEYFSEIEQRFSQRRGSILLLSTLDWALIETWREAGIPLQAVLRGIDSAFDKHDARALRSRGRLRKVNGLAWCAQAVMQATEEMVDAATGVAAHRNAASVDSAVDDAAAPPRESGFEPARVAAYLERSANALDYAVSAAEAAGQLAAPSQPLDQEPGTCPPPASSLTWTGTASATAGRLRELAAAVRNGAGNAGAALAGSGTFALDDLDRTLTVLEERLFAVLQSGASEQQLVDLRAQADRELAPYRARISAVQLRQVQQQFLHKRLLELHALPRLSLFYMGHD